MGANEDDGGFRGRGFDHLKPRFDARKFVTRETKDNEIKGTICLKEGESCIISFIAREIKDTESS